MTFLAAVATYVPTDHQQLDTYLHNYGLKASTIKAYQRFYGFGAVHRDANVGIAAQMVAAARAIPDLAEQQHRIRYVVQSRTMPVAAPYPFNPLHEARDALGLSHAAAFSVNQHACASTLLAVELAGQLLTEDADPDALALIFGGEKTFTEDADVLGITAVMGEGVVAVLVRPGDGPDRLLGYATRNYGQFHESSRMNGDYVAEWAALYTRGLSEVILAAVERAGLGIDDVALILPHHVNKISWIRTLKLLGVQQRERLFLDNLARLGHCFGADSFFNYRSAADAGRLKPGDRYVMTSVGLGATFSAMVFEH